MENKQYYTPSIEEFHVGFEYGFRVYKTEQWRDDFKFLINDEFDCLYDFEQELDRCRVKYLDKEDIESLGYKYREHQISKDYWMGDSKNWSLISVFDDGSLHITKRELGMLVSEVTGIKVKNISELKRLLNQLGIEYEKK